MKRAKKENTRPLGDLNGVLDGPPAEVLLQNVHTRQKVLEPLTESIECILIGNHFSFALVLTN